MNQLHKLITMCAITTMLAACGGGGGGSSAGGGGGDGGGGSSTTKTATVAFSVISTAKLPAPVQGITLVALLPAGTNVATDAGSHTISASALTVGSGISDPNLLVYGSYSAAANKVKIGIVSTSTNLRGGEFARLTVSYPATSTLTASDFTTPNTPAFPSFQAAGSDGSNSIFDLSGKLAASLGVTFN